MPFGYGRIACIPIRSKILLASLTLAAIFGLAGLFAFNAVTQAGQVVARAYDTPLTTIDHAGLTHALALIQHDRLLIAAATVLSLLSGIIIAFTLARHVATPITAASRAAERMAAGELDTDIPPAGRDELSQLLISMSVMRDTIRTLTRRDATAHRTAQACMMNAIAGLNEGVALVDAAHRIVMANSRIADFFATCDTDFVAGAPLPAAIKTAVTGPAAELRLPNERWLRLSRSDTVDGGFVLIVSDITLLKQREILLCTAREQAETADRAKTEFLTNMSHELRTPLTAVIGFSDIIANETLGPSAQPRYRAFAADILHSGRHLLEIINDILDIAKLQSGTTSLRLEPLRSRSVIDDAVRIVRNQAEEAGITLGLQMSHEPVVIHADRVRLRQVLLNLLSNAIKFTPAGGTVSVIAEGVPEGLSITVRDTGIGMAREDIPRVLEPFVQLDTSLARRSRGTGLGLPLSKMFVELHGGRFAIESQPGKGTTVTILLPASVLPTALPVRPLVAA